jgi:hypothetical protein
MYELLNTISKLLLHLIMHKEIPQNLDLDELLDRVLEARHAQEEA